MSDACARYRLTTEEFLSWQTQVDRNGLKGLRATRIQEYRGTSRRKGLWDVRGEALAPMLAGALEDRDTERRNRASAPRP